MKIIVLYGGNSPEREVSLRSGEAVALALAELGHTVALIDPSQNNNGHIDYFQSKYDIMRQASLPKAAPCCNFDASIIGELKKCDMVFPALHGGNGENGVYQALLECLCVPFAGSTSAACALAMDKEKCKLLYESAGIRTPRFTVYKKGQQRKAVPPCYPCVVKPACAGSSIGISFVYAPCGLNTALEKALCVCDKAIIEERIFGTELSVSVLNNTAIAVTQIIPKGSHYDYAAKYSVGGAAEITPAPLPPRMYNTLLNITNNAHSVLGMRNFSRTDIIISSDTLAPYVLETNALPGMTETSILPQAASACGISFCELVRRMLY